MNEQEQTETFKTIIDNMIASMPDDEDMVPIAQNRPLEPSLAEFSSMTPLVGFPDRHKLNRELHGDEWRTAYEKALGIAEEGGIIIAHGMRGSGKTQISYEVARNARFQNPHIPKKDWLHSTRPMYRPAIYTKAMDIFIDLKNGYQRPKEPSEKEVIDRLINAVFLVIDEAHVRGETKYEDDKLTHIIDKRYDAMRATMLITNLDKKDFAATLSPSILSRISEIGGGIECNWKSYRTKK